MYFFAGFVLNLTRFWGTKLRLLVPCCPDFTENSIKHQIYKSGDYIPNISSFMAIENIDNQLFSSFQF